MLSKEFHNETGKATKQYKNRCTIGSKLAAYVTCIRGNSLVALVKDFTLRSQGV